MGWSLGYDSSWNRDIGYGVPAYCDHPGCKVEIDRGLPHVCGSEPYGGEFGCGLYFCLNHLYSTDVGKQLCERCDCGLTSFDSKPDHPKWIWHKLTDKSWAQWRKSNPAAVAELKKSRVLKVL